MTRSLWLDNSIFQSIENSVPKPLFFYLFFTSFLKKRFKEKASHYCISEIDKNGTALNYLHYARRNINSLRYADDTTLMAESEEELKSLLIKVKEESEKLGLKLNIQRTKIMVPGPITSWKIDGKTVETVADFIFLGSRITADGDCNHEIKRRLLLGRKVWAT